MFTREECKKFIDILGEELVPAMGCTEPIAIAYCAAKARDVLGCEPQRAEAYSRASLETAMVMDEARRMIGIVFPADAR